jgi:hypothetical protein
VSSELPRCRATSAVDACRLGDQAQRQRGGVGNDATALCIGEQGLIDVGDHAKLARIWLSMLWCDQTVVSDHVGKRLARPCPSASKIARLLSPS